MDAKLRAEVKEELVRAIGSDRVLHEKADLLPYTKDTYRIPFEDEYRYMPDFVVLPETTPEVQSVVRTAAKHKIPLIPKGGGSNRTGMLVPILGGIVVDTIRMNKVLEVNLPNLYVTVQPGITLTHRRCTIELADRDACSRSTHGTLHVTARISAAAAGIPCAAFPTG